MALGTALKKDRKMEILTVINSVSNWASLQDRYLVEQMVVTLAAYLVDTKDTDWVDCLVV